MIVREGRLKPDRVIAIGRQALEALGEAHALGVIHRDVKPHNFVVCRGAGGADFVKVLDFGISKAMHDGGDGAVRLTHTGMVLGTPLYMSPEQARGEESIDHRIDVYSLAAVVFRCLSGRVPFSAPTNLELFMKVLKDPRPRLSPERSDMSPEIDQWLARALHVDRDQRYPYVPMMWNDLIRVVMNGHGPSAAKARATFRLPE